MRQGRVPVLVSQDNDNITVLNINCSKFYGTCFPAPSTIHVINGTYIGLGNEGGTTAATCENTAVANDTKHRCFDGTRVTLF
jgi:hypothetical protein